ncbi:hypothetical protein [Natrinema versiforme]|uniref:Uncharacterized protein n=1 Tax=Natrinema versiforme TaxID=88724 RepID=A0A4P8WL91_9EURY|nr:hypothetical protein [Natrinema versiforme]QCS43882.1 hypothetical protein FEJ81_16580 [Natrinema versiforme]
MGNEQPTDSDDASTDEQKVRRSIYIPVEVTEWADEENINLSGLASDLLKGEMKRREHLQEIQNCPEEEVDIDEKIEEIYARKRRMEDAFLEFKKKAWEEHRRKFGLDDLDYEDTVESEYRVSDSNEGDSQ